MKPNSLFYPFIVISIQTSGDIAKRGKYEAISKYQVRLPLCRYRQRLQMLNFFIQTSSQSLVFHRMEDQFCVPNRDKISFISSQRKFLYNHFALCYPKGFICTAMLLYDEEAYFRSWLERPSFSIKHFWRCLTSFWL